MAGIQTGHGATLTFTATGSAPAFTGTFISVGGFEQGREVLDSSHLGTTDYRTKKSGDLVDPGEFTVEMFFDVDVQPPVTQADGEYTVRVTYPDSTSGAGAGGYVEGGGFISGWSSAELVTDQLMTASITVAWEDGPTWTDET